MSGQRPYDVIQVADTGSFMMMSSQCLTLGSSPFVQFHQKRCKGLTAFVFTNLVPNLDPSVKH
ncbi:MULTISPECIES: hypothetical protein [unclassified Wolbachia]|uniref:hypothetical protein n=1 Tax=unclassified Wolbachia TaxID=2640676 RepID=UPI0021F869F1|nr:hypothetical protein [Wolbachia endosymbiont (group A) of Cheilosia soror]